MTATSDSGGGTPLDPPRDTGPGIATSAPAVALDVLLDRLRPAYVVERELPPGGMSRVFLARDTALDRMVVVKVLPTHLATPAAVDRFRREILLVAALHHPNVVGIISAGDVDGVPYYVMPYLEGASLAQRLAADGGALPVSEVTAILRDVARALAYAHGRGIVHRDVKPHNVLLVGGAALVTDFGVAKAVRDAVHGGSGGRVATPWSGASITGTGLSVGTPLYMAPEQAAGDPAVDARADVYALGATAYEMLAGAAPFAELPPHALLRAKLTRQPPTLRDRRPDAPPALATLVHACLAVNPAERPASAAAVVERLNVAASGDGLAAARAAGRARGSRRRLALAGAVIATIAMVAALAPLATTRIAPWARRDAAPDAAPDGSLEKAPGNVAAPLAVAIVPLVALSEDSSDAHLAEGLTASAAAALSRLPDVRVVSPSYVQGLLRGGTHPAEAARRVGATLVVEGTLERAAGRLRATARLVEVGTGVMRWAGTFDRGTDELFALQDDVVVALARGLRPDAPDAPTYAPARLGLESVAR